MTDTDNKSLYPTIKRGLVLTGAVIVFLMLLLSTWRWINPYFTKHRIETERRALVREAESRVEADRIRAKGTADANATIAASLTDTYIRWLYVDQMDQLKGQTIYIPTEGGLPILEAERLSQGDTE